MHFLVDRTRIVFWKRMGGHTRRKSCYAWAYYPVNYGFSGLKIEQLCLLCYKYPSSTNST